MKLENVQITNFRCIEDSTPFAVGQVTCLVGKNESGKTSVLHALTRLNSTDSNLSQFDKERDYPRRILTDFNKWTQVLETKWLLSNEDVAAVEKVLGAGALLSTTISIQKNYDTKSGSTWPIQVNERKIIDWLLHEAGCDASERTQLDSCNTIKELASKVELLKATSPRVATILEKMAKWRKSDPTLAAIDVLYERMPKFLYFASYDRMDGNVSLEKLKTEVANGTVSRNDLVFLAFLEFAGTTLDELAKLDRYEAMKARVEAASIKISKQIFKYWSQNRHLKVQFSLEAEVLCSYHVS